MSDHLDVLRFVFFFTQLFEFFNCRYFLATLQCGIMKIKSILRFNTLHISRSLSHTFQSSSFPPNY